jgi:hypothetical protein
MPTSSDELRAALAVAELEEQLADAKAGDDGPSAELKLKLREARRVYREMREQYPPTPGEARPAAVDTTTGVN